MLSIDTTNFYKFILTLTLAGGGYFLSFPIIYLNTYNEQVTSLNIKVSELVADNSYLNSINQEFYSDYKDSLEARKTIANYLTSNSDTTALPSHQIMYYFKTNDTSLEFKNILDSINKNERDIAKTNFILDSIEQNQNSLDTNIFWHQTISYILGTGFLILFLYILNIWRRKSRLSDLRTF